MPLLINYLSVVTHFLLCVSFGWWPLLPPLTEYKVRNSICIWPSLSRADVLRPLVRLRLFSILIMLSFSLINDDFIVASIHCIANWLIDAAYIHGESLNIGFQRSGFMPFCFNAHGFACQIHWLGVLCMPIHTACNRIVDARFVKATFSVSVHFVILPRRMYLCECVCVPCLYGVQVYAKTYRTTHYHIPFRWP